MRRNFVVVALAGVFCTLGVCLAQANPPATRQAPVSAVDAARTDFEAATKKADAEAQGAIESATKDYIKQLQSALNSAMDAANLDEANRMKAEMDRASKGGDIDAEKPKGVAITAARHKYDLAVEYAKAVRLRVLESARGRYAGELHVALAAALRTKDLDGANRIQAEIDEIKPPAPRAHPAIPAAPEIPANALLKAVSERPRLVNLLPLLNIDQDAFGRWMKSREGLLGGGKVRFPYEPPDEYDYVVEFQVQSQNRNTLICLMLPHNGQATEAKFGNRGDSIPGFVGWDNNHGVAIPGPFFESGKKYKLVAEVRHDKIRIYLNDKLVSEAHAPIGKTSEIVSYDYIGDQNPGLVNYTSTIELLSASIQEIKAAGKIKVPLALGDFPTMNQPLPHDSPKKVIDLLKLINPKIDTVKGEFTREGVSIVSNDERNARIHIPYSPPEEYDLRVTFTRTKGSETVALLLEHSGHQFCYALGTCNSTCSGFGFFDNKEIVHSAATIRAPEFPTNNRKYNVIIYVRKNFVAASIDGKLVGNYPTAYDDLTVNENWALPQGGIGVGTLWSPTVFERIEVAEITGEGKILSPGH